MYKRQGEGEDLLARPAVEPHPREKVLAFAGATCALNAGLALLLKVYLY